MADATDWNDLRISGESWLECDDTQGAHDLSHWALDFIPSEPNREVDAEWLKGRGWVKSEVPGVLIQAECGIGFEVVGGKPRIWFLSSHFTVRNPTRMTVALFEAAAMETMKHGE